MKRKKRAGTRPVHPDKPWTPWVVMEFLVDPEGNHHPISSDLKVVKNNQYEVHIRIVDAPPPFGQVTWLSIKRCDRRTMRDWRDLQRIKNELVSPEAEAVELFPSESRLVDTSNQYHLFVFLNYRLPFGFNERLVCDETISTHPMLRNARQRPFRSQERPQDVSTIDHAIGGTISSARHAMYAQPGPDESEEHE
jgi:hypothetical protein